MRDRMAESIEKFGVTTDLLEGNQNYLLIPKKHFSWISESERQLSWIKRRLPVKWRPSESIRRRYLRETY